MTPRYMLDTNICVYLMRKHPPQVSARFAACALGDVVISAITLAELEFGVETAGQLRTVGRQMLEQLLVKVPVAAFGTFAARDYGSLRALHPARNKEVMDKLIASHARALDLTLVTNNQADFHACPGLRVENWAAAS